MKHEPRGAGQGGALRRADVGGTGGNYISGDPMKRLDKYQRARKNAEAWWRGETFIESGVMFQIPPKLSRIIRETIALAWVKGYGAGRREAR